MSILLAWLGNDDLRACEAQDLTVEGPTLGAVNALSFDRVHLLSDHGVSASNAYVKWLKRQARVDVILHLVKLSSPTSHEEVYRTASQVAELVCREHSGADPTYHLSPGTPAMASIWILLAKTLYPAQLIESSKEQGGKEVSIPFDLSAEFVPAAGKEADEALTRLMQGLPPESIIHRCASMKRTVAMVHRLVLRDVPVLIQGESGTGKELFARALHQASARSSQTFIAVNYGAIPQELVDAEFFGHEKGAFTGATAARAGYFESAGGGTLFLDEIGELPLASQVRLLRVLHEREVTRVGPTKPTPIDMRVIAATNQVLPAEIQVGRFREDLFHCLAVGVLLLPPLREREGDLGLLIDSLLAHINAEASSQPGYKRKKLDVSARNLLVGHSWPGNVQRAA